MFGTLGSSSFWTLLIARWSAVGNAMRNSAMAKPISEIVGRPSDEDALRLVLAYYCIMEPDKRHAVLTLAEKFAAESQVVKGLTHFSLLERAPNEAGPRDTN